MCDKIVRETAGGYGGGPALNYRLDRIRLSDIKHRGPAVLRLSRVSLIQI
jgi:hypothetical protein